MKPKLRSLDEAAALTGQGRRTLQTWMSQGLITAYRVAGDRKRYLDLNELERLRQPQALRKARR